MHGGVAGLQQLRHAQHVVADQVFHHHVGIAVAVAQRQAGHGADVLFELVHRAALLRPVARVVDAGRDLVDQKAARGDEKLDPHDADIVQRIQDAGGDQDGIGALARGQPGGDGGGAQDTVAVDILAGIETGDLAVQAACGDHADLAIKGDEAFKHASGVVHAGPGRRDVGLGLQLHLALAVIAKAGGFQDRGQAKLVGSGAQVRFRVHGRPGRGLQAEVVQERLFRDPVLADRQGAAVGADGSQAFQQVEGGGRDVLEFIGDDVDRLGEGAQGGLVLVGGGGDLVGDVASGRGARFIDVAAIAQPAGRDREHPAKLAAAKNADGRALGKFSHPMAPRG